MVGQFEFVWSPARTPHVGPQYAWSAKRNQEKYPPEIYHRSFPCRYGAAHPAALERIVNWTGLGLGCESDEVALLVATLGPVRAAPLVDLIAWTLEASPAARPASADAILQHAFFNEAGALRANFVQDWVRSRSRSRSRGGRGGRGGRGSALPPPRGVPAPVPRLGLRVMLCYAKSDERFVLGTVALHLAEAVDALLFDVVGAGAGASQGGKVNHVYSSTSS